MVSETIPTLTLGPQGYLPIWLYNFVGHNEGIVSTWESGGRECDIPYRLGAKVLGVLYVWAPLNLVHTF